MSEKTITDGLFALKDENYRRFHAKLIPDIPIDNIIGVRTPVLRKVGGIRCAEPVLRRGCL